MRERHKTGSLRTRRVAGIEAFAFWGKVQTSGKRKVGLAGADELDASRAPGCGPKRIDSAIVVGSDSRGVDVLRRSDSATGEQTPPGPSNRARTAMKWTKRTAMRIEGG
jgi:hypothetical protein